MSFVMLGTVDKISTRMDRTISVLFGTQEMNDNDAAALFQYRNKPVKILLSHENIKPEVQAAVIETELPAIKPRSQSQQIRLLLMRLHKAQGSPLTFEQYYNQYTSNIITDILTKLNEIK